MTALYVHIPYCRSKCRYCDFSSVPANAGIPAYLETLAEEAAARGGAIGSIESVYVGGGTPTILTPEQIERLFERLSESFSISSEAEVTVEANPGSLGPETAAALAACGVNRVSLGAQSFVESELSFLGRTHGPEEIARPFSLLREAGIDNISLDLIYAIPNQTPESWRYSLARAIDLNPRHISIYCLTYEPSTPLRDSLENGVIERKSDDEELELYEIARDLLTRSGYEHYEISNFALPGKRSRHNMVYWLNDEYIGLGASAVSYIGGTRSSNLREPARYMEAMKKAGAATCETENIPPRMQAIETVIQRLRLAEGIDCASFERRFGMRPEKLFNGTFNELLDLELLEQTPGKIRPTTRGFHLASEIALKVLP